MHGCCCLDRSKQACHNPRHAFVPGCARFTEPVKVRKEGSREEELATVTNPQSRGS